MKNFLFCATAVLACSAMARANVNSNEKQDNNRFKPIKSCIIHVTIVDENNVAVGSATVDIANPKSYTDCLNKGIEEANKLKDAGVITEKVLVQSYS